MPDSFGTHQGLHEVKGETDTALSYAQKGLTQGCSSSMSRDQGREGLHNSIGSWRSREKGCPGTGGGRG